MRGSFFVACSAVVFIAGVACATASDEAASQTTEPERPGPSDAATIDAASEEAATDADAGGPLCSPAGWCVTSLPDPDLVLKDVWPYATRAFAVAESSTLGVKFLEWEDASASWKYIDDNSQNDSGLGPWVGK